jgi:xylulokinase
MLLGIDIGTSAIKVLLCSSDQQVIAYQGHSLSLSHPQPGWSEQQPEDWWHAVADTLDQIHNSHGPYLSQVTAIGLTGQMHGAVVLNQQGKPLRPAILWNDSRSALQCQQLSEAYPEFVELSANLLMPGFTAPKLAWLKQHEPDFFKQIHQVLLPKDYIRYRLTGDFATDVSDAAGTGWLNMAKRQWSADLISASGLQPDQLPRVYESPQITGQLQSTLAQRWGIKQPVAVVAGAADNPAATLAAGVIKQSQGLLSLGTSGTYVVPSQQLKPNPDQALHAFCHCLPGQWYQMACMLSAAASLTWLAKATKADNEAELLAEVEQSQQQDKLKSAPIFLPYLSGERTPHNDPYAQGVFIGLRANTSRAELTQGVLEGVAFALADGQQAMDLPQTLDHLMVVGGGAHSLYWGQILANVLNQRLYYPVKQGIGPALGAVRLALLGTSQQPVSAVCPPPATSHIIEPDSQQVDSYQQKWARYRRSYQQLKPLFKDLSQ